MQYLGEHISNTQTSSSEASNSQTSSVHEQHYPNQMYPSTGNQYYPQSQYYPSQYGMTRSGGKPTDAENTGRTQRYSHLLLQIMYDESFNNNFHFTEKTVEEKA